MNARTWILLLTAVVLATAAGLAIGSVSIPIADVWRALSGAGDSNVVTIIQSLRLPRVAMALSVGAGLGMSGAAMQATLRNPLAEPYLLGVSGGAAVGSVTAIAMHIASPAIVPLAAFVGATIAVIVVLGVARASGAGNDPRVLVMAGVVVGAFGNAVIMVVLANAPAEDVRGALWWMMGSLNDATWTGARWIALYVALGGAALLALGRDIELLSLGEEPATALGVDVPKATRRVFLVASLLAAVTVAGAGLIGFVGLVAPAIVRGLGARSVRSVIAGAALAGAALLVGADVVARTVRAPAELPLGAVTALIGVPFFLARLRRLK